MVVAGSLILFVVFLPLFLTVVFGNKYESSIPYLYILGTGWSIRSLVQLRSSAIFGMGKIEYNGYASLITLVFNIVAYPLMIMWLGFYGAAYTSIMSGIVIYLSSDYFFRRAIRQTQWED